MTTASELGDHLRRIFAEAWNKRLTPQQWGDNVMEYFASCTASLDEQSHALCDFLLQQSAIGPAPSPLLLSYLRWAIRSSLVSGTRFFQALCEVATPESPQQFTAFLELVVDFVPMINGEAPPSTIKRDSGRLNLRASRTSILTKSTDTEARLTKKLRESEGGKGSLLTSQTIPVEDPHLVETKKLEDLESISRVCLSVAFMLVNGLEHAMMNSAMDVSEMGSTGLKATSQQSNMSMCIEALVTLLTEYRTLGFLQVAKKQNNESWQSFSSKCDVIHQLAISNPGSLPGDQLQSLWLALQRVLNIGGLGYTCRKGLFQSLFSILARHNSIAYTRPWIALAVFVKEEQSLPRFRSIEDTMDKLRILKSLRSLDWYPFLCELWAAAIRLFHASRNSPKSTDWYMSRNFLLVKLPLVLKHLKNEILSERRYLESARLLMYNPIELSIAHVSQFPTLALATSPVVEPILENPEPVSSGVVPRDLIVACLRHELISAENMNSLLATTESFDRDDTIMFSDYSMEAIMNNVSPRNEADVNALFDMLRNENSEESLKHIVDCICDVHAHWKVQELIVDNILQAINPSAEERLPEKLVSMLLIGLTTETAIDVFQLHGRVPEFFDAVIYYANSWGGLEVRKQAEPAKSQGRGKRRRTIRSKKEKEEGDISILDKHELFNSAFALLVAMLEHFEVKSIPENQEIIENGPTIQALYGEQGEDGGQSMTQEQRKDFIRWYESYMSTYIEDGSACDPEGVGSSLLQCLYANMAPAAMDSVIEIPPTISEIASAHTPWQVVDAIPYVMHQVCMAYKMKNWVAPEALVMGLNSLIEGLPYTYVPLLAWCAKELLTPFPSLSTAPNEPIPLSLLNNLFAHTAPSPKVLVAVGNQLKVSIEGLPHATEGSSVLQYLSSVSTEPQQFTSSLSLLQSRFVRVVQEGLPSITFSLYRRFRKRAGDKPFCDTILKAITNTISSGMSNRHSLRAAELGGCILAYCGGKTLVSALLTHSIPLYDFASTKTLFFGQLVAYMAVTAIALSGIHHLSPQSASPEVQALEGLFEYIIQVLEEQLEKPSPSQSFPITFLSLATAVPSIFRFNRSPLKLATLLQRVQQHDLSLAVLLSDTVDTIDTLPSTTTLVEVAKCLL